MRVVIGYEMGRGAKIRAGYHAGRYGRYLPSNSESATKQRHAAILADPVHAGKYNWTPAPVYSPESSIDAAWWCVVEVLEPETNEWGEVCL